MINLSIITITNGDLEPLERTVKSFNSYDNIEWIVISSQKTYPKHFRKPDLFVGNETNGIFSALNLGLEKARGKLIIFMNAGDEFFDPDTIRKILDSWLVDKWEWAIEAENFGDTQIPLLYNFSSVPIRFAIKQCTAKLKY
jgi:glycosyltransferase involved in cell wall biosynthesis